MNHLHTIILCLSINGLLLVACTPAQAYDYKSIASHPRLLMSDADEAEIKVAVKNSTELAKLHSYIIKKSDEILDREDVVYLKQGKRLLAVSRQALTRIFYLSYSYRITDEEKYLIKAERELNAVCNFQDWNPSHFLDVGEMTMAVAIGYDWLYDDLQKTTKQNIQRAIKENAFVPSYNEKHAWFLTKHSNWNSVCNAGLVYGALAIFEDDKEDAIAIIERSLKSNLLPLKAYAPNGNYPEGPGYWNYGTSFQVMLTAALESALGNDNGLSEAKGFMESATYMLYASGTSDIYFNYSDCIPKPYPSYAMFWFANKMNNSLLAYHELAAVRNGAYANFRHGNDDRLLPIAIIYGQKLNLSNVKPLESKIWIGHGETPVAFVRTGWKNKDDRYLGIKGGRASDSHAHMDAGSFVYDIGNLRWAMDFGSQDYYSLEKEGVKLHDRTQGAERWDIFRFNNLNHNTLTINNQKHDVEGKATIIEEYKEAEELGVKMDLTSVLNLTNELKSATRKAVLVNESYLKIEDVIVTNNNAVTLRWNMVTPAHAKLIDDRTIELTQDGKKLHLKFSGEDMTLAIRPSSKPWEYICEYGNYNYGTYNTTNEGTIMVGFDATLLANSSYTFQLKLIEE